MGLLPKMCLWLNHQGLLILSFQAMCVILRKIFIASNRHHVPSIKNWINFYSIKGLWTPSLTLHCSSIRSLFTIFLLVYVDDIIITDNDDGTLNRFVHTLATWFSIKDLGVPSYFLRVEVIPSSSGLFLSQHKYVLDLLERTKMMDSKSVTTPMSTSQIPSLMDGTSLTDSIEYQFIVGGLQYLSFAQPNIVLWINKLSQFMHRPTTTHWLALKHLLCYLKDTTHHDLFLQKWSPLSLHVFSDVD